MEYKSPDDELSYTEDWTNEIGGSTISTATYTLETGITTSVDSKTDATTTVKIEGGIAGTTYEVECEITTAAGETFKKGFKVRVRKQHIG